MKKCFALVLAAALALACVSALAGTYEDYTVDYKFYRQMQQNNTKAAVTLTAEGDRFSLLPDDVWALLRALSPSARLELQNCMNKKGGGQGSAQLLLNGQEALRLDALYDSGTVGLLLPGMDGQWLSAPKDWEWSRLASLQFSGGDVPPLWNLLLEVLAAPKTWQEQAAPMADKYLAELGVWVNSFAVSENGADENGVRYSELRCTVPAEALKDEMKKLLERVFADTGLLSLLRGAALPEEAVYLTPAALPYFTEWVESMVLAGDVEIVRRYDAAAQPLLDSVRLPFATGQAASFLTLEAVSQPEGRYWRALLQCPEGAELEATVKRQGEGSYSGEVKSLSADGKTADFRYACAFAFEDETYSLATDLCERRLHGELELNPLDGTELPPLKAALEVLFTTHSAKRSPIEMTASLRAEDGSTGAVLALSASVHTEKAFTVGDVNALTNVKRLDRMTTEELRALLAKLMEGLTLPAMPIPPNAAAGDDVPQAE